MRTLDRRGRDQENSEDVGIGIGEYLADGLLKAFFVDGVVDLLDREALATRAEETQAQTSGRRQV